MTDQPQPGAPQQPPADQAHADQAYGQQPYAEQPYAEQPYAEQPYAEPTYPAYGQPAASAYPQGYAPVPYASAPYGADAFTAQGWSDKSRTTAGLLSLLLPFVGVCGVGRLYSGQIGLGLAQLLGFILGAVSMVVLIGFVIAPAVWLWAVVDGIVLLANGGRDQYGRPLR